MIRGRSAVHLVLGVLALGAGVVGHAQDPGLLTIPVDFEINGRSAGQIVLRARADLSDPAIQGASLKSAVANRLTPAGAEAVAALSDGFVALVELQAHGIDLVLDVERLVLVLRAAELVRSAPPTHGTFQMGAQSELHPELRLPEADVSGYLNLRLQDTLAATGDRLGEGQPFTADVQSVLNIRGWAFSANTLFSGERSRSSGSHWTVGDLAVTHDVPDHALRWTIGDFSAPIGMLQTGARMGGISLAREFTIRPYETYQPTGTAAFHLQESATVEVYLNGARMRTLKLDAGTYNLEDFNLVAGANDLVLHITSASGRFEEINVTQFSARTLLRSGVSEFALSAGLPMTSPGAGSVALGEEWLAKYYDRDPVVSGFYRRGLSDRVTGEFNAQGAAYWQRAAAGFNLASGMGAFEFYAALNRHRRAGPGSSFSIAWERGFDKASLRLSTAYTDADFTETMRDVAQPGQLAWSHAATVSAPLPRGFDATASAYIQEMREVPSTWGWVARVSRRFGSFVGAFSVQGRRMHERMDTGGFVTVSWMQPPEWSVRSVFGAGDRSVNPGGSGEVNYTRRGGSRYVFANAAVEADENGDHYRGGVRYQDNHVLGEIVHRQVYAELFGQERRTAETVGTLEFALAYADRAWGITRRVEDGFAVVTTHSRWRDVQLGINPAFGGYEHRVRPPLRTAVLGQLRAYRESTSFIQTVDSDQVLENADFVFFPSYRRGTCVVIGSDAVYTVRGTLVDAQGGVVGYRAITVAPVQGGAEIAAFTNVAGRFIVGPIAAGRWRIVSVDSNAWAEIEVAGDETFQRLGTVQLHPAE